MSNSAPTVKETTVQWVGLCPAKLHVEVLASRTSECDSFGNRDMLI